MSGQPPRSYDENLAAWPERRQENTDMMGAQDGTMEFSDIPMASAVLVGTAEEFQDEHDEAERIRYHRPRSNQNGSRVENIDNEAPFLVGNDLPSDLEYKDLADDCTAVTAD